MARNYSVAARRTTLSASYMALCVAFLLPMESRAETTALWGKLEYGPHAVGFELIDTSDNTRTFDDVEPRPIRMSVWYPTEATTTQTLSYGEIVWLHERAPGGSSRAADRAARESVAERWALSQGYSGAVLEKLLSADTASVQDAPVSEAGPFPLVLYAPGYGSRVTPHTVTAEYLASHGYVVVSLPSQGDGREGITFDAAGLETQTRDLEFALGWGRERPFVGPHAATVGFSFGGGAALLTAMRNPAVRAVVGLDGVAGAQHSFSNIRNTVGFDRARARVPLLEMRRSDVPWTDATLIESLHLAPRTWITVDDAQHLDFIPKLTMAASAGADHRPRQLRIYRDVARLLRAFLDLHLKGDRASEATIASLAGATPTEEHPLRLEASLRPEGNPPTSREFWTLLRDPATAADAVRRYRRESESLGGMILVREGHFDRAASSLVSEHPELAVRVRRLWVEEYPESVTGWSALGNALHRVGDLEAATDAFIRALQIDSGSVFGRQGLKEVFGGQQH